MKKIKKYRVSPDESLCLAVSVVDKPAVESEFVFMEQQKENFVAVEKKEKRMIYGCALRCDFPIYRNSPEKGEYYIEFDAEAIDKISKNFLKNGFQNNWTVGHEAEVENLSVCESWIKESPTLDKSIYLELDPNIPVGSWFIGCYCGNDEVWNAVKEGKYHGFSVEALVGLEEFEAQMKEDVDVNDEPSKVEHLENETPVETPTVEPVETPVEPPKVEEPTTTPPVEEKPLETPENKPEDAPKVEEPKDNHLEELINNLKEEIEALKGLNKDLNKKVKDLEKEPSVNPVKPNAGKGKGDTFDNWMAQMEKYYK